MVQEIKEYTHNRIVLPIERKYTNKLNNFRINNYSVIKYESFEDRTIYLSRLIMSSLDEKMSKAFNYSFYRRNDIIGNWERTDKEIVLFGVYGIKPIDEFIGVIPEINQIEVCEKLKVINEHPILKRTYYNLLVLAPLNNFASSNNIDAIDPIIFVETQINSVNYLIPLTQWE